MFLPASLIAATLASAPTAPAPKFELNDGDRIVWIGNTLVEREQRYGYWETALHTTFPDKRFTLRNLGWSGDTVFGDARAGFDTPAKGFERLVSLTLELKPTVIFVSYGTNESFEGKAGLPKFEKGLEKLLDALKPAKARIVLFTPTPVEKADSLVGSAERNLVVGQYANEIRNVADRRGHLVVDPFHVFQDIRHPGPFTVNGMHLTGEGYRITAPAFLYALGHGVTFDWDQSASLRQAVVAKNQLFFYRWRPQNETYLFGFRKHEQGKNAKEVAEFDPLVAKAEGEIEMLRKSLK